MNIGVIWYEKEDDTPYDKSLVQPGREGKDGHNQSRFKVCVRGEKMLTEEQMQEKAKEVAELKRDFGKMKKTELVDRVVEEYLNTRFFVTKNSEKEEILVKIRALILGFSTFRDYDSGDYHDALMKILGMIEVEK